MEKAAELFTKESLDHAVAGTKLQRSVFDGVGDFQELRKGFKDWEIVDMIVRGVEVRPSRTTELTDMCCSIPNYEEHVWKLVLEKSTVEQLNFIKSCLEKSSNRNAKKQAEQVDDALRKKCQGVLSMNWCAWQELVRLDNVDEFAKVVEKGDVSIDAIVNPVVNQSCDFLRASPTLCEFAAFFGSAKCFKYLVDKGAVIRIGDGKGRSLAQFAVAGGNLEIIQICKEKRCDFKGCLKTAIRFHRNDLVLAGTLDDSDTEGILYECALSDNHELLLHFIGNGVDMNKLISTGYGPIHAATYARSINVLELLVACKDVNINLQNETYGFTALHMAALNGFGDCARVLLKHANINQRISDKKGRLPLHIAAQHGYANVIEVFLANGGVTVNSRTDYGATPLHVAVLANEIETVEYLLSKEGIDVDAKTLADETAMHCAARSRSQECAQLILAHGVKDINTRDRDGWTPLHYASRCIEVFQLLLQHPSIDVNCQSVSGTSPLHLVVAANDVERIAALFECPKLNVNIKDKDGWAPIHTAAKNGSFQAVQALSGMPNIDLNTQTKAGWTALHLAIHYNHMDIAGFLLSIPVLNTKLKTQEGWTVLHVAGMVRSQGMMQELIGRGLDPNERDKDGRTPEELSKLPSFKGDGEDPWVYDQSKGPVYEEANDSEEDELEVIPELNT